jgi:hypothetical protein
MRPTPRPTSHTRDPSHREPRARCTLLYSPIWRNTTGAVMALRTSQAIEDLDAAPDDEYDIDEVVTLRTQAEELVTRLQKLEARLQ